MQELLLKMFFYPSCQQLCTEYNISAFSKFKVFDAKRKFNQLSSDNNSSGPGIKRYHSVCTRVVFVVINISVFPPSSSSSKQPAQRLCLVCWSLTVKLKLWRLWQSSTTTRSEYPVSIQMILSLYQNCWQQQLLWGPQSQVERIFSHFWSVCWRLLAVPVKPVAKDMFWYCFRKCERGPKTCRGWLSPT